MRDIFISALYDKVLLWRMLHNEYALGINFL